MGSRLGLYLNLRKNEKKTMRKLSSGVQLHKMDDQIIQNKLPKFPLYPILIYFFFQTQIILKEFELE